VEVIQVNQWMAVAGIELLLRLRDTNVPIMAACVAAACVLLTPSADASYAVITFGGMKPVMSAESALVSAGLVLSLLMLPVYALGLGLGCARDRRLRTGAILASSPVEAGSIAGGRLVANAAVVTVFSLVTLILIRCGLRITDATGLSSAAAIFSSLIFNSFGSRTETCSSFAIAKPSTFKSARQWRIARSKLHRAS